MNTPLSNLSKEELWQYYLDLYRKRKSSRMKVTQEMIAKELGVSKSYVNKVLHGIRLRHLDGEAHLPEKRQHYYERTGYTPRPTTDEERIQLLLSKCKPLDPTDPDTCLLWQGPEGGGNGNTYFRGKTTTPQKKLWTLTYGKIPKGQWVTHTCPNGLCCNINHLTLSHHHTHTARPANRQPLTPEQEIQWLLLETTYDKDDPDNRAKCWIWRGYRTPKGQPRTLHRGQQTTPQRKLYLLQGRPLPPTHKITNRCGNPLCCNPAHIIAIPKRKLPKLNLRRGY